jgi:hypothetical protein
MSITFDDSPLSSIMVKEQLCAELKKSVTDGFSTLSKVRGNVFLIRSISIIDHIGILNIRSITVPTIDASAPSWRILKPNLDA